jgi:drug/metabolite transporter superfamily protein YnfA
MADDCELWEQLVRHTAGASTPDEVKALSERVAHDPTACDALIELTIQGVAIRDFAETQPSTPLVPVPARSGGSAAWSWWSLRSLALAASVMAAVLIWHLMTPRSEPMIGRVESASGGVQVLTAQGWSLLAVRDAVPAGTLRTALTDTASIRLLDGTLVLLGTDTELRLTDSGQKRLELKQGMFMADVVPQPDGRPMIVHTPSAEMEVKGTSFSVAAKHFNSHLQVEEGLVSVRRIADHATVDVPAGQQVEVSPIITKPLQVQPVNRPADHWSADLSPGLPEGWGCGEWEMETASVLAVVDLDNVHQHYSVKTNNGWSQGRHSLAALHDDSVFRITLQKDQDGPLLIVLCLRQVEGLGRSYVGNIYYDDPPEWVELTPGDWRTLEIPLAEFRTDKHLRPPRLAGRAVYVVGVTTLKRDIGLRVKDIAITRRSNSPPTP